MTDDLVKRLREVGNKNGLMYADYDTTIEAADRIEALELRSEQWKATATTIENERLVMKDRIEQLEAAYAQQQQIWSDAIARADRYEKALAQIYAWYPISVSQPRQTIDDMQEFARAALGEKKDVG